MQAAKSVPDAAAESERFASVTFQLAPSEPGRVWNASATPSKPPPVTFLPESQVTVKSFTAPGPSDQGAVLIVTTTTTS